MRIYLRAIEPDDAKLIYHWRQNHKIVDKLGGNIRFISMEREQQWATSKSLDDSSGIYFGICLKDDDTLIGYGSINSVDMNNLKAQLGGVIIGDIQHRGKGLGKEAHQLIVQFAFRELPINRLYGYCLEQHDISHRLMKGLGMSFEGTLRDDVFKNGKFQSLSLYSILRPEFEKHFSINGVQQCLKYDE